MGDDRATTPSSHATTTDKTSQRPRKRRALTPTSQQSAQVEALFANPPKDIVVPSGPKAKTLAPPPEIVANVQGSSAGAGSGEFHVYKASRRREYERLRMMDEEVKREKEEQEFEERKREREKKDAEKTGKNKARRARMKANKQKGKGGMDVEEEDGLNGGKGGACPNKKLKPNPTRDVDGDDGGDNGVAEGGEVKSAEAEESGVVIHDED